MLVQFGGPYTNFCLLEIMYFTDKQYIYPKTTHGNIQCPNKLMQVVVMILYFYLLSI